MPRIYPFIGLAGLLLLSPGIASAQKKKDNDDALRKEIELLKRENEVLKRENELLKKEIDALKQGGTAKPIDDKKDSVTKVLFNKVEYEYLGISRDSGSIVVSVMATSKDGDQSPPGGDMTLIDPDGEKYVARSAIGFGTRTTALKEGVPVKLTWTFRKASQTPSAKITRFTGVTIQGPGGKPIDFRNVPAEVKPKGK